MKFKNTLSYSILKRVYHFFKRIRKGKSLSQVEFEKENYKDRISNTFFHPLTESAIAEFKRDKGVFNGFALTESSVRAFLSILFSQNKLSYHICEFGGGQSTIFWNTLSKYVKFRVTTFEHDPNWTKFLQEKINNPNFSINFAELMQVEDSVRNELFSNPIEARKVWDLNKMNVTDEDLNNPILKNGFYDVNSDQFPKEKIDAIVLDGPHGNGRSLSFPFFFSYISEGTLILIDDYHHYSFLDDLNKLFNYIILEKRNYNHSNKGWVIVSIISRK